MATVTATDFLVATGTPGLWVRLHNNVSGTDYYSTAVSDPQGAFTYTVPTGEYSLYVGSAATVPGTPTLRNGHFQVAVRNGDDAALNSGTFQSTGPYIPSAAPGSIGNVIFASGLAYDNSTDDWVAAQAAITAAQNLGGADVWFTGLGAGKMTFKITKTLLITASNVRIRFGPGVTMNFVPTGPFVAHVNDRAIDILGTFSAYRQVAAGAIAIGATSFTAQNAGDTADLVQGDWVFISERDSGLADIVICDYMQVQSVTGGGVTVNVVSPFRIAFANARAYNAGVSGLSFRRVTNLVQGTVLDGVNILQPAVAQSNPSISIAAGTRHSILNQCVVNNAFGQAYFSYQASDVQLENCIQIFSGTASSEFAATSDLTIHGCTFGQDETTGNLVQPNAPNFTVDFGTHHFEVTDNRLLSSFNAHLQLLNGVTDGVVASNTIGWVAGTGTGISMKGCIRVQVVHNIIDGGTLGSNTGIGEGPTTGANVNINGSDNLIAFNTVKNFTVPYSLTTASLLTAVSGLIGINRQAGNAATLSIQDDAAINDMLHLQTTNAANPRTWKMGPQTGGVAGFGLYDSTGAVLAWFYSFSSQAFTHIKDVIYGQHLIANMGGSPPATSALGANITSVTFTGNDRRGTIAVVVAAGGLAANTRIATCTFAVSYGASSPFIQFTDQTGGVLAAVNPYKLAFSTGVSFDLACKQALVAGTYTFSYIVEG